MATTKILVFDVETTGTDKQKDQVIELCVQHGLESDAIHHTWRIRPEVAISAGAQSVHGISAHDLIPCPLFAELADEIRALFTPAEMLVGYNLRFDIDMLQAEYRRLRQPPLDLSNKLIVDPYRLWQNSEPRSLMDAHRRFVGGEFSAAHSAQADVAATGRVLSGMVSHFGLPPNWDSIADICEPERAYWIGGSGHVRWSESGQIVFGFGKHAGVILSEMALGPDAGYMQWLVKKDFPLHVIDLCNAALSQSAEEFVQYVEKNFPRAAVKTTGSVVSSKVSQAKPASPVGITNPSKKSLAKKVSATKKAGLSQLPNAEKNRKVGASKKRAPVRASGVATQMVFDL